MNPDNPPIRDEIDQEKVEHDKSAKCYRHDSDGLHSKENTTLFAEECRNEAIALRTPFGVTTGGAGRSEVAQTAR